MLLPIAVAVMSVGLGAALALVPGVGSRALRVVSWLAVAAALAAVGFELMPPAITSLGTIAVLLAALGFMLPGSIELLGRRLARDGSLPRAEQARVSQAANEIAYWGLIVHSIGDGAALWTYASRPTDGWSVVLALGAHTVPVAALVALRFSALAGRRAGMLRAAGLCAATVAGTVLADSVPPDVHAQLVPWVDATVSGLLLHIAVHARPVAAPCR